MTSSTASIAVRSPFLRNLLREDFESSGYAVVSVSASGAIDPADVVVTDIASAVGGRYATVRIGDLIEVDLPGRVITYPIEALDHLCDILHAESNGMAS